VITSATATIALSSLNQIYDGTAKTVQATSIPSGLAVSLTYNGSPGAPTNAGSYAVVGTIRDPNYNVSVTNTLVISRASATVALSLLSQVYDGTAKAVRLSTTPAGLSFALTYNGGPRAPTNAGTCTVVGRITDSNYTGAATNTLAIARAKAAVAIANLVQAYDGTPKSVTVTTTPRRLKTSLTYNGKTQPPTRVARYAVIALVNDLNYYGGATNTLTIQKGNTPTSQFQGSTQLAVDGAPPPATLAIRWAATANDVVVYRSVDLKSWEVLATVSGFAGQLTIESALGNCFFRAEASGPSGTVSVPLSIGQE
jgi:hypothetical protein